MTYAETVAGHLTLGSCCAVKANATPSNAQTGGQRQHGGGRYSKVFDQRKRRIRGLWERNGPYYAQLSASMVKPRIGNLASWISTKGSRHICWKCRNASNQIMKPIGGRDVGLALRHLKNRGGNAKGSQISTDGSDGYIHTTKSLISVSGRTAVSAED
jgi:hypothetical protein